MTEWIKHPEEALKPQPRGYWVPIDIWNLSIDGTITFRELRLLLLVESLVRAKDIGCFASNKQLAKRLKCNQFRISRMVSKLTQLGLLISTGTVTIGNLKYRMMETNWSRIRTTVDANRDQEKNLEAKVAAILKSKTRKVKVTIAQNGKATIAQNGKATIAQNGKATIAQNGKQSIIPLLHNGIKEGEGGRKKLRPPTPSLLNSNLSPMYYKWGDRLRRILHTKTPQICVSRSSRYTWACEFRKLHNGWAGGEEAKERIEAYLDGYGRQIQNIDSPIIKSAKEFRDRCDWLESKILKLEDKRKEEESVY